MIVLGIDCGLSGAVCRMRDDGTVDRLDDVPTHALARGGKNKREIDTVALAALVAGDCAFVEQVGAMPGQGVSAVFAFGKAYGIVLGIIAAKQISVTLVSPRRWKAALAVPAEKDGARARASQLMPAEAHRWTRVKDDGRAEAALIARYGILAMSPPSRLMRRAS